MLFQTQRLDVFLYSELSNSLSFPMQLKRPTARQRTPTTKQWKSPNIIFEMVCSNFTIWQSIGAFPLLELQGNFEQYFIRWGNLLACSSPSLCLHAKVAVKEFATKGTTAKKGTTVGLQQTIIWIINELDGVSTRLIGLVGKHFKTCNGNIFSLLPSPY